MTRCLSDQLASRISRRIAPASVLALSVVSLSAVGHSGESRWEPLHEPSVGGRVTSIAASPHDPGRVLVGGDMLGVGISTNGGDAWGATFGFKSWEIGDFTWHPDDPDTVWVGTMGGPYVSHDGGVNWTAKRSGLPPVASLDFSAPIEKVLFDPNDSHTLLAFGGSSRRWRAKQVTGDFGAVWKSTDGGDHWSKLTTITATGSSTSPSADGEIVVGAAFAAGSSNTILATVDDQGVYRSTDAGATWRKMNSRLPHTHVERIAAHPSPSQSGTFYVSLSNDDNTPGGVYRSTNAGASWSAVNDGLDQTSNGNGGTTARYKAFDMDRQAGSRLLAVDDRFGSSGIYVSDNGGLSWSNVLSSDEIALPYPSGIEMEVAHIAAANADLMYAAGSANFVRSADGGTTWIDAANQAMGVDTRGKPAYRGRGYSGLVASGIAVNPWDADHILLSGGDAARLLQSKDGGQSWTFEANTTSPFGGGSEAVFASADIAYATLGFISSGFKGIARTTDGGNTWQELAGRAYGLPEINGAGPAVGIHAATNDPARAWAVIDGDVYHTTDGGESWSTTLTGLDARWLAATPDTSRLYVSTDFGTYASEDGTLFTPLGGPAKPGRLDVGPDGTLWLPADEGGASPADGLWKYTASQGWQAVLDPNALSGALRRVAESVVDVAVDPTDPLRLAIATSDNPLRDVSAAEGVFISEDGGLSWRAINEGLPMLRVNTIEFNPHDPDQLLIGTSGRGFFSYMIPEPATGVFLGFALLAMIPRRSTARDRAGLAAKW